jgi:membrane-associated phospholipid phosphatase
VIVLLASLLTSLVDLDHRLFLSINHGLHALDSEAVDGLLQFWNQAGTAWVIVPILGAMIALSPGPTILRRGLEALGALGLVALVVKVAKHTLGRSRPLEALADSFRAGDARLAFGESGTRNSLPSGHTATVFAVATVLWVWAGRLADPRRRLVARLLLALGACLTAVARIYAGMHFPSDVLAGALAGIVSALVVLGAIELVARRREGAAPAPAPTPRSGQDRTNP